MVGYVDGSEAPERPRPATIEGIELPRNVTMQCEGERPGIEWEASADWGEG